MEQDNVAKCPYCGSEDFGLTAKVSVFVFVDGRDITFDREELGREVEAAFEEGCVSDMKGFCLTCGHEAAAEFDDELEEYVFSQL